MADHAHQSLETLIQYQMGVKQPGDPQRKDVPVSGLYLWTAIGQELRRARLKLASTRTTMEMEAAAARLRGRLLGDEAGGAVPPASLAILAAEAAKA